MPTDRTNLGAPGTTATQAKPFRATPPELPPMHPQRLKVIRHLVDRSFTATPQQGTFIAGRLKALQPSPDEVAYIARYSGRAGDKAVAAKQHADLHDLVHTVLPALANVPLAAIGSNTRLVKYAAQHPVARAEEKGPFTVKPGEYSGSVGFWLPGKSAAEGVAARSGLLARLARKFDTGPKTNGELPGALNPKQVPGMHEFARPTIQKGPPPTAPTLGETATEALTGARGLRAQQERLRSTERAQRAEVYAKGLQQNPTLAGHKEAKSALAGKLPALPFQGFQGFTPETMGAMVRHVADHPDLQPFEKTRTIDALGKLAGGTLPTKSEEKLLRQVFGPDTTSQMAASVSRFHQLKALGYDVANIPRAVMASADVSGAGRQALLMATSHPSMWAKNLGPMFHALTSQSYYDAKQALLREDPFVQQYADKMGLDLTELSSTGSTALREEPFASPIADKIPGVKMSGRAFTYFLNKGRVDLAKYLHAKAVARGLGEDPHTLDSIGSVVNSQTGRGELGHGVIGRSADGINLLFFSPRLIKSRVDFLNPFWYRSLHPVARHEAYRAVGGLAVLMTTALSIAHEAGAQVNLDPRSSDFAKIKVGNTRIDLAGGFQQYIRILSELATQQTVSSTGKVTGLAPFRAKPAIGGTSDMTIFLRFLRNKLAPVTSGVVDVGTGANAVGNPISLKNTLLPRVVPLAGQDAFSVGRDAAKATGSPAAGILAGIGAFGLSGFGTGVQNFKPKTPKGHRDPWGVGGSSGGPDPWNVSP